MLEKRQWTTSRCWRVGVGDSEEENGRKRGPASGRAGVWGPRADMGRRAGLRGEADEAVSIRVSAAA